MSIKYFYYISKSKVNMLQAQIQSGTMGSFEISPKFDIAGLSLGVNLKTEQNPDLVKQTLSLVNAMNKKQLIKSLPNSDDELLTSDFYYDQSTWYNGVFSTKNLDTQQKNHAAYVLWRLWNNSIVMLVGSPSNIIGGSVFDDEWSFIPSTSGAISSLYTFIRKFHEMSEDSEDVLFTHKEHYSYLPSATNLAGFCLSRLRGLPQSRIDMVFKIFTKLDFERKKDLPQSFHILGQLPQEIRLSFEKCRCVYIGSPLYTALA